MGVPASQGGSATLLHDSGLLLAARAAQTLFGAVTFVVLTRRLGPAGFGEVVTASGFVSVVGGVVGTALSDAAVTAGGDLPRFGRVTAAVALVSGVAVGLAWAASGGDGDGLVAALGGALFVSASAATAGRTALARVGGDAWQMALLQAGGALATLAVVGSLASAGVSRWGPYVLAYAAQPAALLLLRRSPRGAAGPPTATTLRDLVRTAGPFLLSQAIWPLLGLTNIVVLRALSGPATVGRYGAMVRILDLVGLVGPLLGTFALPAFARLQRTPARRSEISRLNLTIAVAATLPVVAGMHLAWVGWRLAYPDLRFPVTAFAVLAAAYGLNSACGLPDRVLQSGGAAPVVARAASAALAAVAVLSPLLVWRASLVGAGVALLLAVGGVNVAMLVAARPTRAALAGHAVIAAVVAGGACAVASGWATDSAVKSGLLVVASVVPLVVGVVSVDRWHRRAWASP
jgi:O-antigen/teichoic acid export membrane protein